MPAHDLRDPFDIRRSAGIHDRVGYGFWEAEKQLLREQLKNGDACAGVCLVISQIGTRLREYFPGENDQRDNELPDDIIYG